MTKQIINSKAQKLVKHFTTATRQDGSSYCYLNDSAPEQLKNAVRTAHGERFPDDFIYSTFLSLLERIGDYDIADRDQLDELRGEIVDGEVDVMTYDLTKWLNSDVRNVYYLTEALEEGIIDGFQALTLAQYKAIDEVMEEVISLF